MFDDETPNYKPFIDKIVELSKEVGRLEEALDHTRVLADEQAILAAGKQTATELLKGIKKGRK